MRVCVCVCPCALCQMWTFNVDEAKRLRDTDRPPLVGIQPHLRPIIPRFPGSDDGEDSVEYHPHSYEGTRFPITHPRLIAPRTVLFNDGGLHVSACGRFMVVTLAPTPVAPPLPRYPVQLPRPCIKPHARALTASVLMSGLRQPPQRQPRLPPMPRFRMVTRESFSPSVSAALTFAGAGHPQAPPPSLVDVRVPSPALPLPLPSFPSPPSLPRSFACAPLHPRMQAEEASESERSTRRRLEEAPSSSCASVEEEGDSAEDHIRVAMLSLEDDTFGAVVRTFSLPDMDHGTNVTSVKLSPILQHILVTLEPPAT